jgi:hypothetical protein
MLKTLAPLFVLLLAAPIVATAQGVEPDMRVRVWTSSADPVIGRVIKIDPARIVIDADKGPDVTVARASVVGVDIGHERPQIVPMFKGALIGAAIGAVLGLTGGNGDCSYVCYSPAQLAAGGAAVLGVFGGLVGIFVDPGTHWERTAMGPLKQPAPSRKPFTLTFRRRF